MASGIVEYIVRLTDKTKAGTASAVKGSQQLENQTKQTARAVDDLGDESAQTGRQLDRMGKEGRKASGGLAGLTRGVSGALSSVGGLTAGVGGLVGALGVGALVGTLTAATSAAVAFGQEIADLRNDITDASTRSGIATDTLQGLRLAAEGSGLAFSALTPGLDQFGRRLVQAAEGGNATAEAFEDLGVKVRDDVTGQLRDADTVLRETLSALNGMESGGERTALALETLGKSGGRLLQALSGSELEDFVSLARDFGVDVGPDAAKSAGDWQRASAELSLVVDGLKASLFDAVGGADALSAVADELIFAFAALSGGASAAFDSLSESFTSAFAPLATLADALGDLIDGLQAIGRGDFSGGLDSLTDAAANLGQALTEAPAALATASRGAGIAIGDAVAAGIAGAVSGVTGEGAQRVAQLRISRARIASGGSASETPQERQSRIEAEQKQAEEEQKKRAEEERRRRAAQSDSTSATTASRADLAAAIANAIASAPEGEFVGRGASVGDTTADAGRANEEFLRREMAATRAAGLEAAQTSIGVAGQVLSGDVGGGLSSAAGAAGLAGLGVAGAAVSGLQFIGEQGADGIRDTLDGLKDSLIAALEALPELIGQVLPEFAISLVETLIPALVANAPDLFKSLIFELPLAIGAAIAELLGADRAAEGIAQRLGRTERGQNIAAVVTLLQGRDVTGAAREELSDGGAARTARTASDGQRSTARAADRLSSRSTRPRRRQTVAASNPFDALASQYDAQYGTYGRATSTTIRPAS